MSAAENGDASNVVDFKFLDPATQNLIRVAIEARSKAYCPYSKFQVGCALLCEDGTVVTGCNVENKSFGLSICAERTALVKAVSDGRNLKGFRTIAVVAHQESQLTPPCGACREFLCEFGTNIDVYITRPALGKVLKTTTGQLLPFNFQINSDYSFS